VWDLAWRHRELPEVRARAPGSASEATAYEHSHEEMAQVLKEVLRCTLADQAEGPGCDTADCAEEFGHSFLQIELINILAAELEKQLVEYFDEEER
jgi:hypothetical protein